MSQSDQVVEQSAIGKLFSPENFGKAKVRISIDADSADLSTMTDTELNIQFLLHALAIDHHKSQRDLFNNELVKRNKSNNISRGRPSKKTEREEVVFLLLQEFKKQSDLSEIEIISGLIKPHVSNPVKQNAWIKTLQNAISAYRKNQK